MIPKSNCDPSAFWRARRETPAALAQRRLATVRHLQSLDPAIAGWYKGVDGRGVERDAAVGAWGMIVASYIVNSIPYVFAVSTEGDVRERHPP